MLAAKPGSVLISIAGSTQDYFLSCILFQGLRCISTQIPHAHFRYVKNQYDILRKVQNFLYGLNFFLPPDILYLILYDADSQTTSNITNTQQKYKFVSLQLDMILIRLISLNKSCQIVSPKSQSYIFHLIF